MWAELVLEPFVARERARLGLVDDAAHPRGMVVWDNVAFHDCEGVITTFAGLNIATADLPKNMTDLLQPMDLVSVVSMLLPEFVNLNLAPNQKVIVRHYPLCCGSSCCTT